MSLNVNAVRNIIQQKRAGNIGPATSNSGVVRSLDEPIDWWSREEAILFENWASAFQGLADQYRNPYFDYYYTGQDIKVSIEGLGPEDGICLYQFGYSIQQQKQPVYGFWSYCVDDQTEALTNRGWVNGDELKEEDLILSMDPKSKELKWSSIKSIYRNYNYKGKMFKLDGSGIDALVTPGHKFALKSGELKEVDKLTSDDVIQLMGTEVKQTIGEIYQDAFVELLGWYITEGHDRNDVNAIELAQSETQNPEHLNKILACLDELGVHYSKCPPKKNSGVVKVYIGVKENIVTELKNCAPNKVPTYDFIFKLSTAQRRLLIDTMIAGDGWKAGLNGRQYVQKNEEQLDVFMALCALSGISTYKGKSVNGCKTITLKVRDTKKCRNIDFHGGFVHKTKKDQCNEPTEEYNGLVWCPETEYGTFVCRRNDKVFVTGNTYDGMLRGTRLITGAFSLIVDEPHGLARKIAKAAEIRAVRSNTSNRLNPVRGIDEDEANINRYWRRNIDFNLDVNQQHLFSVHPPFNFLIQYGLQSTSLSTTLPGGRSEDIRQQYRGQAPLSANYNERLVEHITPELNHRILLENVELVSKSIEYNVDGDPILENYAFIARDERIVQARDYTMTAPPAINPTNGGGVAKFRAI